MQTRISESIVTFRHAFSIGDAISDHPAGSYRVLKEEELIEGVSYPAYHAVSTSLQLPAIGIPSMTKQFIPVAGSDLNAALDIDVQRTEIGIGAALADPESMAARARNFDPSLPQAKC